MYLAFKIDMEMNAFSFIYDDKLLIVLKVEVNLTYLYQGGPNTHGIYIFSMRGKVGTWFELRTFCYDTIKNYQLFQCPKNLNS